jgi:hypothetical protein
MNKCFVSASTNKASATNYANRCCLYELHIDRDIPYLKIKNTLPDMLDVFAEDEEILLPPNLNYVPTSVRKEAAINQIIEGKINTAELKDDVFVIQLRVTKNKEIGTTLNVEKEINNFFR